MAGSVRAHFPMSRSPLSSDDRVMTKRARGPWWLPTAGLLALSVIPILGGALRVTELGAGAEITPANARYFASPVPVVVHIIAVTTYSVLGAFQFPRAFRAKHRRGHRVAGRVLVLAGIITALTGLWMTLIYPGLLVTAISWPASGSWSAQP